MLIEFSKLSGLPIGMLDEARKGGEVIRVVFDHQQMKVIGFLIKAGGLFSGDKVVSLMDVVSIDRGGVVIGSAEDILAKGEIVRVGKILKKNAKLIGLRVYGKDGKFLGFLNNGVIETQTGDLVRIYVGFLWRKFIFSKSQIVEFSEKKVVIDTDSKIKKTIQNKAKVIASIPEVA